MAKHLKRFGWEYVVVDLGWYLPPEIDTSTFKMKNPPQEMDPHGRLVPHPGKVTLMTLWSIVRSPLMMGGVALFNRGEAVAPVEVPLARLGLSGTARVRDLWKRAPRGEATRAVRADVEPHGAVLLKLTPKR
jgi:hypothetical protein